MDWQGIDFGALERKNNLPSGWLNAVLQAESSGDPAAVGPVTKTGARAQGGFQFMPDTAKHYGIDPLVPEQAADGAARMFADLFKQYGNDQDKVLAGYNWGSGNIAQHGMEKMPSETRNYITKVKGALPKQFADAGTVMNDASAAPALADIDAEIAKRTGAGAGAAPAAPAINLADIDAEIAKRAAPAVKPAADVAPPVEKGILESFAQGGGSAISRRGIGIIQTLDTLSGHNLLSDQIRQAIPVALAKLDEDEKGTGITGVVTGAIADPINLIAGPVRGPMAAGAIIGGAGGFTNPTAGEDSLGKRVEDAAVGAGVGAVTGKAVDYGAGKIKELAGGITNRMLTMFGSRDAADKVIYGKLAEKMLEDGLTPDEVMQKLAAAKRSGVSPTLAEATGSRGAMQYEKKIAGGAGAGATKFNQNIAERGTSTISGVLEKGAEKLRGAPGAVDDAYAAAAAEGNATIANSMPTPGAPPMIAPPGGASNNPNLLDSLTKTLTDVQGGIKQRLKELGPVNNLEKRALQQAQIIMAQAKKRGGSFDALLDAKKQLDDLFIEGADNNAQKKVSGFVTKYVRQIDDVLGQLSPNAYPAAKTAAKSRMAAKDIETSMGDAKVGNIGKVVSDIWGSPAARDEFLRKLPDAATRQHYTDLFTMLDKISQGFGGRPRPVNTEAVLPKDFLGVASSSTSPLGWFPAITRKIGETFVPKLYERGAEAAWAPNADRLAVTMQKQLEGSPLGQLVAGLIGGQAGMNANQPAQPRQPLKVTISKDPNIGPDGLPRVNLPAY